MGSKTQEQDQSSAVAIFTDHTNAENAIKELKKGGFDIKKLSIVGRDYHSEENVVGFYQTGDRMKYWGKMGAFWGGLWGLLAGAAFLIIPGIGPVVIAGPVAAWIVGALEGAVFVGGVSALGAGLVSLGIPKDKVLKYESSIKAGKFLLLSHGTDEDVLRAKKLLETTAAEEVDIHRLPPEPARVA
jgi:hypothetical protein